MTSVIKRFFRKKDKKSDDSTAIRTTPLPEEAIPQFDLELSHKRYPAQFIIGSGQSVGRQRDHNEDTLFAMSSILADEQAGKPFGLCIIADGMGGHRNGEVASSSAARAVVRLILNRVYGHFLDNSNEQLEEGLQEILELAVQEAQKSVVRHAPGGGTTLTIALIVGGQITVAHVGDSRAYFVHPDSRLEKITRDHSLVQTLVDREEISEAEAFVHPQKNVLLRAVGQPDPYRPDLQSHQIPKSGKLMLCSDGLWGVLPEGEMMRIIGKFKEPVEICHELVEAANAAGGPDNISVVIIDFIGD
jgi:PPM family protein phosphatase